MERKEEKDGKNQAIKKILELQNKNKKIEREREKRKRERGAHMEIREIHILIG